MGKFPAPEGPFSAQTEESAQFCQHAYLRVDNDSKFSTGIKATAPLHGLIFNSIKWRVAGTIYGLLRRIKRTLTITLSPTRRYRKWIERYDVITPELRSAMTADIDRWLSQPLISVIILSYNNEAKWLNQAVNSVRKQIYGHWELCISDDASMIAETRPLLEKYAAEDSRIRVKFRGENGGVIVNYNAALALASGDYVALLDADDVLSEDALFWVAREIAMHPEADLLFSDEDKIDLKGTRFDPCFKSAWNPALMLSQNAFRHLGTYRRDLVEQVGGFREGYEGAHDYDLVLRCAARTTAERIRHIPRVLYHARRLQSSASPRTTPKPDAWKAGRSAIGDYLQRAGLNANIKPALGMFYQVDYDVPQPPPLVSILTPTTLSVAATARCLGSVLTKTTYKIFELLVLIRAEDLRVAKNNPDFRELLTHPRVRVIDYNDGPFNFSRVNNLGVRAAQGSLLCFLNDDIEVITEEWLERLVARAMLEGVGAVGPMLYYPPNVIQHAGVVLVGRDVADHAFKRCPRGHQGYFGRAGLEQDYSAVTAACMMMKRDVFESVGGFDEMLPVAFNDVDLCLKIRRAGLRIIWTPTVEMYHCESFTLGRADSPARRDQFGCDVRAMRERWTDLLDADPCYNPNLSIVPGSMFSLAWPPRMPQPTAIVTALPRTGISRTSKTPPGNLYASQPRDS